MIMSSPDQESEIQRIVEQVVQRVRRRLQDGEAAGSGADDTCEACSKSDVECTGCGHSVSKRPDDARRIVNIGASRLSSAPDIGPVREELARLIDHTLLKAEASKEDLKKLCDEARNYSFFSVCVNSSNVRYCRSLLEGTGVKVVAVVGFPLGAMSPEAKAFEAREAVRNGAEEIDMVINVGALKSGDHALVLDDIRKVVAASGNRKVKVIIETSSLNRTEKIAACVLSKVGGAAFVKTSTGFGAGGATAEDVALMHEVVGGELEVKASGGIHYAEDVDRMVKAGATRIGASASVAIVFGKKTAKAKGY